MKHTLQAISIQERVSSIDILRGFALLGILLVNILGFNASFFDFGGFYNHLPDTHQQLFYQVYISLTADKFIFIFSFLFGYGMFMQTQKFQSRGADFRAFFIRRMWVLALFGIGHILFLWAGDILLLYAIAGFALLLLSILSTRWRILFAVFFYFFIGIWLVAGVWLPLPNALSSTCTECLEKARIIYANGVYFECLQLRLQEYQAFRNINAFYYLPKIIGVSLLGYISSSYDLHQQIANHKQKWWLILIAIAGIGAVSYFGFEKIVDFKSPYANAIYMTAYEFMNVFVAGSYLLLIMLVASYPIAAKCLRPLALMGYMSLTNYIMQSIILSLIFYGWGWGLFGMENMKSLFAMALCIFVCQLIVNSIWFRFYKQGPLEKLWRYLSYKNS